MELYINAVILAIVEGVTEFLPVSSTGHLILFEQFFSLDEAGGTGFTEAFEVIIQLPAILAVVVYFFPKIWPFQANADRRTEVFNLWYRVVAAFIPAAILGLLLDDFIESMLFAPLPVGIALIVGGIILIIVEKRGLTVRADSVHDITYALAIAIGFFQCLAMIPGTSRSAATIIGGMVLGLSRAAAAEFSFFLAIPTMLGATTLKLIKGGFGYTPLQWTILGIGSVISFITALAVIAVFMRYIQRRDFVPFGVYRIVIGAIVVIYFMWIA